MNIHKNDLKSLATIATIVAGISASQAATTVVNGDFEASTFDTGWTNAGATAVTGALAIGGAGTSASLAGGSDSLKQDFDATDVGLADFQLNFMFNYTGTLGNDSRIRIGGDTSNANPMLSLRLTTAGIENFTGSWGTGVTVALNAATDYYVRLIGNNFGENDNSRFFTLGVSTDGSTFTTGGVITGFHNSDDRFETFTLEDASGATILLDNVSLGVVPEPSSTALLGLGGALLAFARRRRA
ncbi:MAG: PEP-CTERM sorting domain-containing protein [Verrucomicrobiae bacterium]|nr:PEP-CTERM sorting domain-containing protein [Verrucomicrobiae bacterium]NNJ85849.1 PEP-CTERM sorting domain-containing protein [Akkermansiaceae bacterium]